MPSFADECSRSQHQVSFNPHQNREETFGTFFFSFFYHPYIKFSSLLSVSSQHHA